jgi:serine/threonine protein phosphatase PrpC
MMRIESAGMSDVGRKRKDNQDHLLLDEALGLFIVADGMGGHKGGETASRMVVHLIRSHLADGPDAPPEVSADMDTALSQEGNRLLAAIRFANAAVHRESLQNEKLQGMGSTLAAVWLTPETFIAANVGDSPIYLVHKGEIETLSVAHTVAAEQPFRLDLSPGAAIDGAFGHMLTRGMGIDPTVQADICESPCFRGDHLVICSDGLSGKLTPSEILAQLDTPSCQVACRRLIDLANARGGDDNISVIVIKIKSTGSGAPRLRRIMASVGKALSGIGAPHPS